MKSAYYLIPDSALVLDNSFAYGDLVAYDRKRVLAALTSNTYAQRKLQGVAFFANYLRGLGSGADAEASGEKAVFSLLPDEPVIFDVGANHGEYAHAAYTSRPRAHVHCFEPSVATFRILSETLSGTSAVLNNTGLGAENSEATLFSTGDGSGLASLSKRRLDHFGVTMDSQETVQIKSLDSYCDDRSIDTIDLLKIDVEGHEMDVLRGASRMLSEKRIRLITFEFGGCDIDTRTFFQDFYYLFKKLGTQSISRITPSGWLCPVEKYTEDLEHFRTTNYLVRL
jgi:FkbM family methyltransferase